MEIASRESILLELAIADISEHSDDFAFLQTSGILLSSDSLSFKYTPSMFYSFCFMNSVITKSTYGPFSRALFGAKN